MLVQKLLRDFRQLFPLFGHFELKSKDFFTGVLIDEFLNIHESTADSHHEHTIDDLCRDDFCSEQILLLVNSIDWHIDTVLLDEVFQHLVDHIIINTFVLNSVLERVVSRWLGLLFDFKSSRYTSGWFRNA